MPRAARLQLPVLSAWPWGSPTGRGRGASQHIQGHTGSRACLSTSTGSPFHPDTCCPTTLPRSPSSLAKDRRSVSTTPPQPRAVAPAGALCRRGVRNGWGGVDRFSPVCAGSAWSTDTSGRTSSWLVLRNLTPQVLWGARCPVAQSRCWASALRPGGDVGSKEGACPGVL